MKFEKSWKKRWKEELDAKIPPLREDVQNEPIHVLTNENVQFKKPWCAFLQTMPRRVTACISACAVALIVMGVSLWYILRPNEPITASNAAEIISVEVNPQVLFSVDDKGNVIAVVAANADADVILSEKRETEMKGKTIAESVKIYVDYCAKLGYINLNEADAIRVTSCAESSYIEEVGEELSSYFRGVGAYVAVVSERLGLSHFCQRMGIAETDTLEKVVENVTALPTLFYEKEAKNLSLETLQQQYLDSIVLEDIKTEIEQNIKAHQTDIEASMQILQEISEMNERIIAHKDNPYRIKYFFFGKDYWTLKISGYEEEYTKEFADLMAQMATMLDAYEVQYGVKISGQKELDRALSDCEALPYEKLQEFLSDFTMDIFSEYYVTMIEILENIGLDMTEISLLYTAPSTAKEYTEKMQARISQYSEKRFLDSAESYQEVRQSISKDEYDAFLAEIVTEYGSLNNYFEKN